MPQLQLIYVWRFQRTRLLVAVLCRLDFHILIDDNLLPETESHRFVSHYCARQKIVPSAWTHVHNALLVVQFGVDQHIGLRTRTADLNDSAVVNVYPLLVIFVLASPRNAACNIYGEVNRQIIGMIDQVRHPFVYVHRCCRQYCCIGIIKCR